MKRVLVIDDSYTVRKVVEMLLQPLGYSLAFAEDATTAVPLLKDATYDAVVIDYGLPGPGGMPLAAAVKSQRPDLPVLLMVGSKDSAGELAPTPALCDDMIDKPFDSQTFLGKIDNLKAGDATGASESVTDQRVAYAPPVQPVQPQEAEPITLLDEDSIIEIDELFETEAPAAAATASVDFQSLTAQDLDLGIVDDIAVSDFAQPVEEVAEPAPAPVAPAATEDKRINLDEFFSDLNDILVDDKKPKDAEIYKPAPPPPYASQAAPQPAPPAPAPPTPPQAPPKATPPPEPFVEEVSFGFDTPSEDIFEDIAASVFSETERVKPVIAEAAREMEALRELSIPASEAAAQAPPQQPKAKPAAADPFADIWDFEPAAEVAAAPASAPAVAASGGFSQTEIERAVWSVAHDVIERIAWEVVPEIIESVLRDKGLKK